MPDSLKIPLIICVALAATLPLAADPDSSAADQEPKFTLDFESSSHVVRQEDERINFRYYADKWTVEGLLASLTPRFREDRSQTGVSLSRAFGAAELTALFRFTDKSLGEDTVASLRFARAGYGAELTFAQADLAVDNFLAGDSEDQFVGRLFWRLENGVEFTLFGAASGTFDLMRGTGELLDRLPRSEIVGAETLADLYVDEERLEDSAGLSVGFERDGWSALVYVKSGEQTLRGFVVGDDFTGFGGRLEIDRDRWSLSTELDLRQLDTPEGFSFERGRFLIDFTQRSGRLEWGLGGYVQGESEKFTDIPDIYDTAGLGLTAAWTLGSGKQIGFWAMAEDNAPDFQTISRLAFFRQSASRGSGERRYGLGVRRDEIGQGQFGEEEIGPFVFGSITAGNVVFDGDLGVSDGDAYGRLSIGFRR